jgi:hypothetical protein
MRRNCLITIVIWFALIAGYAVSLRQRLGPPELFIAAAAMGTAVGAGLLMFKAAANVIRDSAARDRLARGQRPRDGELVAAVGEIRPMMDPLHAPFTGRECVAYTYRIGGIPGHERATPTDYVGFGFTRCAVHTPYGSFAIGSFPVLEGFGMEIGAATDAARYIAETKFEQMNRVTTLTKTTYGLYMMTPPVRIDWSFGEPAESMLGRIPIETIVESGARVTAYGRYSARDQSIITGTEYVRLVPQLKEQIRHASALGQSIGGLMIIGAAHLILWAVLTKF